MNKKGMYFTILTIGFLLIFIFVFVIPGYSRLGEKMAVTEMRVDSMNDFIKDLQRDLERGLYISSFRSIMAMEQRVINTGTFLNDSEHSFKEALLNGTVEGINSSLMVASKFTSWIENVQSEASKLNIEAGVELHEVRVYQTEPWKVSVWANLTLNVSDSTGIATWEREEIIETQVKIAEFEDPLYVVYSLGRITNIINITPYGDNYTYKQGDTWYVDNFMDHINDSYYTFNPDAPSFLMRFESNLSGSSCCGIESLVNLKELESVGFSGSEIHTQSSLVDHYYWVGVTNGEYRINLTPSWVKLDGDHLSTYDVVGLSYPE